MLPPIHIVVSSAAAHSEAGFVDTHPPKYEWYQLVGHDLAPNYLKLGWVFSYNSDHVGHHERWSRMMVWPHHLPEGETPPIP